MTTTTTTTTHRTPHTTHRTPPAPFVVLFQVESKDESQAGAAAALVEVAVGVVRRQGDQGWERKSE